MAFAVERKCVTEDEYGLRVVDDAVVGDTQGCGFSPAATSAGSPGSMATTNRVRRSNQLRAGPSATPQAAANSTSCSCMSWRLKPPRTARSHRDAEAVAVPSA